MKTKDIAAKYQIDVYDFERFLMSEELPCKNAFSGISVSEENVEAYVEAFRNRHSREEVYKTKAAVIKVSETELLKKQQLDHEQYQKYLDKIQYLFTIPGCRGRTLTVCKNKCIITTDVTLGSLATGNATDGEKMIFFKHCASLQFKESGFSIGYLQFETPSMQMNNQTSNFFSENTFTFQESNGLTNKIMRDVFYYVMELIENCASGTDFVVPEYPDALEKYLNPAKDILKRN